MRYGFRRIHGVHVAIANGRSHATVTGVAHRYPRTVPVSLRVAAELAAAGAPLTIDRAAEHGTQG